jgi:two-component system sensor histidine kinase KdpD
VGNASFRSYNEEYAPMKPYIWSTLSLVSIVGALVWLRSTLNQTSTALILVVVVTAVAIFWGRGPALATAIIAGLAFNFFFLEPYHSFAIRQPQDVAAFLALAATAVLVGQLATRLRRHTEEAEVLRRGERLKSALLDAVTHDLRTPLTSIKASAATLRSPSLGPQAREELCDVIEQESDRLNHFVEGMTELAQLRAGIPLANRPVAAEEIIENALIRAERLLRDREVIVTADPELSLNADPRLLAQVLFALLENGVKYSPQGSTIRVSAVPVDADQVVFSVADQGIGIPAADREWIFQHFQRGDQSSGMGLGLAIARTIVEAHHGRIWVEAHNGNGTEIRFSIPDRGFS